MSFTNNDVLIFIFQQALLCERKRHTAYCIASARSAVPVLGGWGVPLSWLGEFPILTRWGVPNPDLARGVPHLDLARGVPQSFPDQGRGTPVLDWGGYPILTWLEGYPSLVLTRGEVPQSWTEGVPHLDLARGVPQSCPDQGRGTPVLDWGGTPS